MDKNLVDFVQKLAIKRLGKKNADTEDIAQEVFINLHLEGITEIEGNELRINHLVVYHMNKLKRLNNKYQGIENQEQFDKLQDVNTSTCDTQKIIHLFNEFREVSDFKEKDLDLFYNVKFLKIPYKETGFSDNATTRKKVNRILVKFKNYLSKQGIKLEDFYED